MFGDDNAQAINGTDKNEFIDGKGGRDTINAGGDDDTVAFDANDESINGGDGADTLLITDTIDLTKIQTDIVGFEKIVLQNEDKNLKLAIDGLKVRDMLDVKENGQDNILEIIGKNGDVLGLKGFAEITDAKEIAGDSNRFEAEISSKMGEYKFYKTTVDESTFYVQVSRHIEVKQDENIF
jgi:von willebrand factor type A